MDPVARGLLAYLRASGIAEPDVPGGETPRVVDLSRTHSVFRVELADGRRLVVKRARARPGELAGNLERELAAYRLAEGCGELSAAMPRCLLVDPVHQVLVLEAVEPGAMLQASGLSAERGRRLGRLVASWQRATSNPPPAELPGDEPWVLGILTPGRWRPPVADALLVHGVVRRELRARLAELGKLIEPSCLVHGDLKWDNCLGEAGQGVRVVDWETAGVGDPAWDVAGIVQEYTVARRAEALTGSRPQAGRWASLGAFLDGYRDVAGPGAEAVLARALPLGGARLVQTALEWAAAGMEERAATALLGDALAALRSPERLLEPRAG
jgi:hypothetical protein